MLSTFRRIRLLTGSQRPRSFNKSKSAAQQRPDFNSEASQLNWGKTTHKWVEWTDIQTSNMITQAKPPQLFEAVQPRDSWERTTSDLHPDIVQAVALVDAMKSVTDDDKQKLSSWIEDNALTVSALAQISDVMLYENVLPIGALSQLVSEASWYYLGSQDFADSIMEKRTSASQEPSKWYIPASVDLEPFVRSLQQLFEAYFHQNDSMININQYWVVQGGRGLGKTRFCHELASLLSSTSAIKALETPIVSVHGASTKTLHNEEVWYGIRPEIVNNLEQAHLAYLCSDLISSIANSTDPYLLHFSNQLSNFQTCIRAIKTMKSIPPTSKWILLLHIDNIDEQPLASIHLMRGIVKEICSEAFREENCLLIPVLSGTSSQAIRCLDPGTTATLSACAISCRLFHLKPLDLDRSATFVFDALFQQYGVANVLPAAQPPVEGQVAQSLESVKRQRMKMETQIRATPQFWNLLRLVGGVPSGLLEYAQSISKLYSPRSPQASFRESIAPDVLRRFKSLLPSIPRVNLDRMIYEAFYEKTVRIDDVYEGECTYGHLEAQGWLHILGDGSKGTAWVAPIVYFLLRPNWFPEELWKLLVDFEYKTLDQCIVYFERAKILLAAFGGHNSVSLRQLYGSGAKAQHKSMLDVETPLPPALRFAEERRGQAIPTETLMEPSNTTAAHLIEADVHRVRDDEMHRDTVVLDESTLQKDGYFLARDTLPTSGHTEHWITPFSAETYHSLGTPYSHRSSLQLTSKQLHSMAENFGFARNFPLVVISPNELSHEVDREKEAIPPGIVTVCGPEAIEKLVHSFVPTFASLSQLSNHVPIAPVKNSPVQPKHWQSHVLDNLASLEEDRKVLQRDPFLAQRRNQL